MRSSVAVRVRTTPPRRKPDREVPNGHSGPCTSRRERPRIRIPVGCTSLDGQCGQVEPGRPALRPLDELMQLAGSEVYARARHQRQRLRAVHREICHADFEKFAVGAQAPDGQRHRTARRNGELPAGRQTHGELGDRLLTLDVRDGLRMVDHHRDRGGDRADGSDEPGNNRNARRGRRHPEAHLTGRRHPAECGSEVGEQHDRIVVMIVAGQPRHPGATLVRPLGEHRSLPVSGGRNYRDHRYGRRRHQLVDQTAPGHRTRTAGGRLQLRLQKFETRPWQVFHSRRRCGRRSARLRLHTANLLA